MRLQAIDGALRNSLLVVAGDLSAKPDVNCVTLAAKIDFIKCVCLNVEQGFEAFT